MSARLAQEAKKEGTGAVIQQVLEASSLFRRVGSLRSYTLCLSNLGLVHIETGQYEAALEYLNNALAIQRSKGYTLASR